MNQQTTISINWTLSSPPIEGKEDFKWSTENKYSSLNYNDLDESLDLPSNTLGILAAAFSQNLTRFHKWDLDDIEKKDSFKAAAKIFKRGVAVKQQKLKITEGSYSISFFNNISNLKHYSPNETFVLVDANVEKAWHASLPPTRKTFLLNEKTKTLQSVALILDAWKKHGRKKEWLIIGGGILSDAAAFAAAHTQSEFTLVPTTLLSMIDACVGGKTGVNFPPFGKNQVGLFAFPRSVMIYPQFIESLPQRQINSGISESLKHALLKGDKELCHKVVSMNSQPGCKNLLEIIEPLIRVKAEIVSKDPSEQGIRATLNLGHTLAHALEAISHKRSEQIILHGEAVGMGLLFSAMLSQQLGLLKETVTEEIYDLLKQARCLLTSKTLQNYIGSNNLYSDEFFTEIMTYLRRDKKMSSSTKSKWILLQSIGECAKNGDSYTTAVDDFVIQNTWQQFLEKIESLH